MSTSQGTVKWFNDKKRFGFIAQDSGDDVFVHQSHVQDSGMQSLVEGDRVEFEIGSNEKSAYAFNLKKL